MNKKSKVIAHLKSGKPLSKLECINRFGYLNLGDIVYELRCKGFEVQTIMTPQKNGSDYAVYRLKGTP